MRTRYWAESPTVNYLRSLFGIVKPKAAQWGEWDDWKQKTKAEHPVGYWMTEKLPEYLEKIPEIFVDPFHNARYYVRNRWHRQTHVLPTRFKPGEYHDLSERLLHGMMESLVDFVEVEKAWMQYICAKDDEVVTLDRYGRSAKAGLDYLQWEVTLDDPSLEENERSLTQAASAREVIAIYTWWKSSRPNRPEADEVSGWSAYCDRKHGGSFSFLDERIPRIPEEIEETGKILDKLRAIEQEYEDEDQAMMIRLVKIRHSLWT